MEPDNENTILEPGVLVEVTEEPEYFQEVQEVVTQDPEIPVYQEQLEAGFIGLYCTILFSAFLLAGISVAHRLWGVKL